MLTGSTAPGALIPIGTRSFLPDGQDAAGYDGSDPGPKDSLSRDSSWSWGSTGEAEAVWGQKINLAQTPARAVVY